MECDVIAVLTCVFFRGMGHSSCPEEMDDVEAFIRSRLPALGEKAQDRGKPEL